MSSSLPSALRLLVGGIFDYAGMFPPASLSFEEALRASASFSKTLAFPGLVGSDIVLSFANFNRLREEKLELFGFESDVRLRVCVLGNLSELGSLRWESPRVIPVSFEVKAAGEMELEPLRSISTPLILALEPDLSLADWESSLARCVTTIRSLNQTLSPHRAVLKIRGRGSAGSGNTGIGPDRLARVIEVVCEAKIGIKATAAMHHPIIEADRYQNELGFLNFLAALYLRRVHGADTFPRSSIEECLRNDSASAFSFSDGLSWRGFSLNEARVRDLKQRYSVSVGSCSLHEPDHDLGRLFNTT